MTSCKTSQFLYNLILHSLTALTCSLLCSYPYWFPSLCTSMKHLFISLPYIWSCFFNPKCLFIVVNVIVVFLVGESKLVGSHSSPANEIYDEYVERSRRVRGVSSTLQEKEEEEKLEMNLVYETAKTIEHKEVKQKQQEEDEDEEEEEEEEEVKGKVEVGEEVDEEKEGEGEEEHGLPTEELNRRIEEFIARVNKQRWLEAKSLVYCKA